MSVFDGILLLCAQMHGFLFRADKSQQVLVSVKNLLVRKMIADYFSSNLLKTYRYFYEIINL